LSEHKNGAAQATNFRAPWRLIYYEAYTEEADACWTVMAGLCDMFGPEHDVDAAALTKLTKAAYTDMKKRVNAEALA
jgi:hypothetical protein